MDKLQKKQTKQKFPVYRAVVLFIVFRINNSLTGVECCEGRVTWMVRFHTRFVMLWVCWTLRLGYCKIVVSVDRFCEIRLDAFFVWFWLAFQTRSWHETDLAEKGAGSSKTVHSRFYFSSPCKGSHLNVLWTIFLLKIWKRVCVDQYSLTSLQTISNAVSDILQLRSLLAMVA
jgi:hypothetical protein